MLCLNEMPEEIRCIQFDTEHYVTEGEDRSGNESDCEYSSFDGSLDVINRIIKTRIKPWVKVNTLKFRPIVVSLRKEY